MRIAELLTHQARSLALVGALLTVTACGATRAQPISNDDVTRVQVENRGWVDMTIYAVEGGAQRRRLGVATATSSATFVIPRDIVAGGREIQFLADPIGGRGNSTTQRIYVTPGQTVVLQISP